MPTKMKDPEFHFGGDVTPEVAFAILLRKHRLALGLSQADLEDEGIDRSYISKLELGKREITLSRFIRLAQKLDITPDQFVLEILEYVNNSRGKSSR